MTRHFLLAILLLAPITLAAETQSSANTLALDGADPAPATVSELSWLSGYWQGEGLGGWCEEFWGDPIGDRMLGLFTLRQNNNLVFSEHMSIVEEDGSLVLKVKHFTADFMGWETKEDYVRFPLVKLGKNEAYFDSLTLRREGTSLTVYLVISQNGVRQEQTFTYQLVR